MGVLLPVICKLSTQDSDARLQGLEQWLCFGDRICKAMLIVFERREFCWLFWLSGGLQRYWMCYASKARYGCPTHSASWAAIKRYR